MVGYAQATLASSHDHIKFTNKLQIYLQLTILDLQLNYKFTTKL